MLVVRCRIAVSVALMAASAAAAAQQPVGADRVPLSALVPELRGARIASVEDIREDLRHVFVAEDDLGFHFEGDFNSDGRGDVALLGLYDEGGNLKSFALLVSKAAQGWARTKLFTFDESFIIGRRYDTGLVVFSCTHCDFGHRIVWTGSDFVLQPTSSDAGVSPQ